MESGLLCFRATSLNRPQARTQSPLWTSLRRPLSPAGTWTVVRGPPVYSHRHGQGSLPVSDPEDTIWFAKKLQLGPAFVVSIHLTNARVVLCISGSSSVGFLCLGPKQLDSYAIPDSKEVKQTSRYISR